VGPDPVFTAPTADSAAAGLADPSAFPVLTSLPGEQLSAVRSRIKVMQAEHMLCSDWAMRTVDFPDAHQPKADLNGDRRG